MAKVSCKSSPGPTPSRAGSRGGALGFVVQRRRRDGLHGARLLAGGQPGLIVASGGALLAGVKAPAIILLAFIPMYMIAVAYQELNKAEPDCGTTFTWASRAFSAAGRLDGRLGHHRRRRHCDGEPRPDRRCLLVHLRRRPGLDVGGRPASSTLWSTVAGVIWIIVMTYICYRGIEVSARIQYALLGIDWWCCGLLDRRPVQGLHPQCRELLAHAVDPLVLAGRTGLRHHHRPAILTALIFIYWAGTPRWPATRSRRSRHHAGPGGSSRPSCCWPPTPLVSVSRHRLRRHRHRGDRFGNERTPRTCSPRSGRTCSATASSARSASCCSPRRS